MDSSWLRHLADHGIGDPGQGRLAPQDVRLVAEWCWDFGVATSDAKFLVLWRALVPLCDEIEDRGHIQTAVLEQVNCILTARLGAVISAPRGEEGTVLAASIRDDLLAIGLA